MESGLQEAFAAVCIVFINDFSFKVCIRPNSKRTPRKMEERSIQTGFNYHAERKPRPTEPVSPLVQQMATTSDPVALKRMTRLVRTGVIETDFNVPDKEGESLLHKLARQYLRGYTKKQNQKRRIRHQTRQQYLLDAAKAFVDAGADPTLRNYAGRTPAQIAQDPEFTAALGLKPGSGQPRNQQRHQQRNRRGISP